MKKFLSFILSFIFILSQVSWASSNTLETCKSNVFGALSGIVWDSGVTPSPIKSYIRKLSDLMSTQTPSYQILDEVQVLMRDARIELKGICSVLSDLPDIHEAYVEAYGLQSCNSIDGEITAFKRLGIIQECNIEADKQMNTLLDALRELLLTQAVQNSLQPLILRIRSLNARLVLLITQYSRLVNNFFDFEFRLGDTITGEWD